MSSGKRDRVEGQFASPRTPAEAELVAEEIRLGLRCPDGSLVPEPARPKMRSVVHRLPREETVLHWGEELAAWLNSKSNGGSKRRVLEHLTAVQGWFATARQEHVEVVKGGAWLRCRHVPPKAEPAVRLLYRLTAENEIERLRTCAYQKCSVWFFSSNRPDNKFHTDECRKAAWQSEPERKRRKADQEKKRRANEKNRNSLWR